MKKFIKIITGVLCALILLVALCCVGVRIYFKAPVSAYYKASEKAFEIPGLRDNFVPQGFHYDKDNDRFLISGYSSKKAASSVYLVDASTGEEIGCVKLLKKNGEAFTGHAGGVALFGNYLYIAGSGSKCVFVYDYSQVLSCKSGEAVKCLGSFYFKGSDDDYVKASFVSVEGNRLIVGEFFSEPDYPTLDSHKTVTLSGEKHGGVAIEYSLSESAEFGIDPVPTRAYSIRDKVQGITFDGGKIYLSTSLGFKHSYIYEYSEAKAAKNGEIVLAGCSLPLYELDGTSLENTYKAPPMAEEIVFKDGRMYVMCESACNKYILGKLASAKWCYATSLEELRKAA